MMSFLIFRILAVSGDIRMAYVELRALWPCNFGTVLSDFNGAFLLARKKL